MNALFTNHILLELLMLISESDVAFRTVPTIVTYLFSDKNFWLSRYAD